MVAGQILRLIQWWWLEAILQVAGLGLMVGHEHQTRGGSRAHVDRSVHIPFNANPAFRTAHSMHADA